MYFIKIPYGQTNLSFILKVSTVLFVKKVNEMNCAKRDQDWIICIAVNLLQNLNKEKNLET